jgi:hypothetical protein
VPEVHKYIGFAVLAVFTVGWVWGLGAFLIRREPGRYYWIWLSVAQIVALVQALAGIVLLILGYRPDTWLHLVYGFGPIVVFAISHGLAREEAFARRPWLAFALAGFICFGLALRAVMTGLGMG